MKKLIDKIVSFFNQFPKDKYMYFVLVLLIAYLVSSAVRIVTGIAGDMYARWEAGLVGVWAAVLVFVAKELYDHRKTGFEDNDLWADLSGCVFFYLIYCV